MRLVAGIVLIAGCSSLLFAGPAQLNIKDVRPSMEEIFNYHVEYKEYSPFLARRSFKLYIEQFDLEKTYLLSSEVKLCLNLTETQLVSAVTKYQYNDFSDFATLNGVIQQAILRAQALRETVAQELITSNKDVELPQGESYLDYARTEAELKARIRRQLIRALLIEKKMSSITHWTQELKRQVFALWEKRFRRLENGYLEMTQSQKKLPKEVFNHFFAMHILKAMAKGLDAHTAYFSPEEAFEMRTSLEKQFDGIGVVLREGIDGVVIIDLIKGGPAEKSGKISIGDHLSKIDGAALEGESYEKILNRLQGSGSGKIRLGFRRVADGKEISSYEVELKKEKIVMQNERVQYSFERFADGIIGKLLLPSFYESGDDSSCEKDLKEALRALKKEGKLLGVILDMRENSGGFLTQAVKVTGLFISSGVVVISKYAQGKVQYLRDIDGRSYYTGPLIVLTSKASASAAEIVAQALQDYGTAIIVGDERTYGKGTIQYQTVTDLQAVSFFKVTVGRYYTVSGRSTQIEGVLADVVLPTVFSAYPIGERYLEYPLKSDRVPSAYVDPLLDIDQRNKNWFEKNYLPNLQKRLSTWTQMLPVLKTNNSYRLSHNNNYQLFLKTLASQVNRSYVPTSQENFGADDLQMGSAVELLKDMIFLNAQVSISK